MKDAAYLAALSALLFAACTDAPAEDNQIITAPDAAARADAGFSNDSEVLPSEDAAVIVMEDAGDAPDFADTPDSALPDAAMEDPDAMIGPQDPVVGTILLSEQPEGAAAAVTVGPPQDFSGDPGCIVTHVNPDAPAPADPASADGGEITVTGISGGAMTFRRDANGRYQPDRGVPADLFGNGTALHGSGSGGATLGAFEIDLTAPQEVSISSPSNLSTHDHDRDLPARWNAGAGASMLLTLFPIDFGGQPQSGNWIICGVEDTGSFAVPSAMLDQIDRSILGQLMVFAATRIVTSEVSVDENTVIFAATTSNGLAFTLE